MTDCTIASITIDGCVLYHPIASVRVSRDLAIAAASSLAKREPLEQPVVFEAGKPPPVAVEKVSCEHCRRTLERLFK